MEYKLILIPLAVLVINQAIKMIIELAKGSLTWPSLLSYGGMPSSHSALVTSLATVMAYYQGLNSAEFAMSIILALIVMRDASGIRWQLGNQGRTINQLIKELPDDREYHFPVLSEKFGHKNTEVLVGILLGLVLTIIIINILP
ncbi:MAG: hypothetical protein C3F02_02485 [Parcubacteria group bacterium]|nr:MAG: hypothetical protein C3F02_02485 [Parcubacteria group bacterium]